MHRLTQRWYNLTYVSTRGVWCVSPGQVVGLVAQIRSADLSVGALKADATGGAGAARTSGSKGLAVEVVSLRSRLSALETDVRAGVCGLKCHGLALVWLVAWGTSVSRCVYVHWGEVGVEGVRG